MKKNSLWHGDEVYSLSYYNYHADPSTVERYKMSDGEIGRAFNIDMESVNVANALIESVFWGLVDKAAEK